MFCVQDIYLKLGYFRYYTFLDLADYCYQRHKMSEDNNRLSSKILYNMSFLTNMNFVDPYRVELFNINKVYLPDSHCIKHFLIKHYLMHSQNDTFIEKSLENTYQLYNNLIKRRFDGHGLTKFDKFYSFYFKLNVD
jgi:hypothetical protein